MSQEPIIIKGKLDADKLATGGLYKNPTWAGLSATFLGEGLTTPVLNNPNFVNAVNTAKDDDQRRACWRYINAQTGDAIAGGCVKYFVVAAKDMHDKAALMATDRKNIIMGADNINYKQDQPKAPGTDFIEKFMIELPGKSANFHQQLIVESTRFGLNPIVLKGCLKALGCITYEDYSPDFLTLISRFLKYSGRPIFPELSNAVGFTNTNYKISHVRRGRFGRRGYKGRRGFKRSHRRRSHRRRRY